MALAPPPLLMSVLLTGYEPFGDHETNPTEALARDFDGETVAGHEIQGDVLPVEFDAMPARLHRLLDDDHAAVLGLGLAGGRPGLSVERVGINVADCGGVPDNSASEPYDERLEGEASPDARFATIDVVSVVDALLEEGVPAYVSNTAGTHLCNAFLYTAVGATDVPTGFVHCPFTPAGAVAETDGVAGGPTSGGSVPASMSLDVQRRGVERALEAVLDA